MLLDRDTEELYFPGHAAALHAATDRRPHPRRPGHASGAVMESGRSELVADADVDPRFNRAIRGSRAAWAR